MHFTGTLISVLVHILVIELPEFHAFVMKENVTDAGELPLKMPECESKVLEKHDYEIESNGDVYCIICNKTLHSSEYQIINGTLHMCIVKNRKSYPDCEKWAYDPEEYVVYPNKSVFVDGEVLEPGNYEIDGDELYTCSRDFEHPIENISDIYVSTTVSPQTKGLIYIGKIGAAISIIALSAHLLTFCLVPTLRNLPGYNLASFSISILLGYCFVLIGQIRAVVGMSCIISAVLQQNFFLVAFAWMNVMAFDVWRTLKLATEKLILSSNKIQLKRFMFYSLYAWGVPLLMTASAVIVDNTDGIPDKYKPHFGHKNVCWMTSAMAKTIFFIIPAFTLFIINAIFFSWSAYIIVHNTMTNTNDHEKTARINFVLYARLGLIMGITWLIGIIAIFTEGKVMWYIFDILNSLQGLFVFMLFTCSRKVVRHLSMRVSFKNVNLSTEKTSSNATKSETPPQVNFSTIENS